MLALRTYPTYFRDSTLVRLVLGWAQHSPARFFTTMNARVYIELLDRGASAWQTKTVLMNVVQIRITQHEKSNQGIINKMARFSILLIPARLTQFLLQTQRSWRSYPEIGLGS